MSRRVIGNFEYDEKLGETMQPPVESDVYVRFDVVEGCTEVHVLNNTSSQIKLSLDQMTDAPSTLDTTVESGQEFVYRFDSITAVGVMVTLANDCKVQTGSIPLSL